MAVKRDDKFTYRVGDLELVSPGTDPVTERRERPSSGSRGRRGGTSSRPAADNVSAAVVSRGRVPS